MFSLANVLLRFYIYLNTALFRSKVVSISLLNTFMGKMFYGFESLLFKRKVGCEVLGVKMLLGKGLHILCLIGRL